MLTGLIMLASIAYAQDRAVSSPRESVREKVCKQRLSAIRGKPLRIVTVPTLKKQNESGVLLLINCSNRKVVSLRDPSRSQRHVREYVYIPGFRARMRRDPHEYEVLNFNEEVHQTAFEHTAYSSQQNWTGPCHYPGLELTTVAALASEDRQTIKFDLNICHNLIVALFAPTQLIPSNAAFSDSSRKK